MIQSLISITMHLATTTIPLPVLPARAQLRCPALLVGVRLQPSRLPTESSWVKSSRTTPVSPSSSPKASLNVSSRRYSSVPPLPLSALTLDVLIPLRFRHVSLLRLSPMSRRPLPR